MRESLRDPAGGGTVSGILRIALVMTALLACASPAVTQEDVPFFETPKAVVAGMLELGEVDADDVVYDLGSGDGRIVIAAAVERGARGVGIEIQPELVARSIERAREAGVADRVSFVEGDLFETDFADATVVMFYLQPKVNRRLAPLLAEQLAPGTRVISHRYAIDGWQAVKRVKVQGRWIYLYRVPATF